MAYGFSEGLAAVRMEEKGPWGFINKSGVMVIKPQFDAANSFHEGLAVVRKGTDTYGNKNEYAVIDKTGKMIIPFSKKFIGDFENGRALAEEQYISHYVYKNGKTSLASDIEVLANSRYAMASLGKNDMQTAYELFKKGVEKNYPPAQYLSGYILMQGGPLKDQAKGSELILKAAAANHPEAMYFAGYLYGTGTGVAVDYAKAMDWYKKAEALGIAAASKDIGIMHEKGMGAAPDVAKAAQYYQKAADAGDAAGMYNLASSTSTAAALPGMITWGKILSTGRLH